MKKTKEDTILNEIRKKSKRILRDEIFTEFFCLNKNRNIIEFLKDEKMTNLEIFFKSIIREEFRQFVKLKIYNSCEEEINTWYFEEENLVLVIEINYGFEKQEISTEINVENFFITSISSTGLKTISIEISLLNDFFISFLKKQAFYLQKKFNNF